MNELTPNNLEINRHIDLFDNTVIRYEARWGIDRLPKLVPPALAAKWDAHMLKLNDAIQRGDLPMVSDLVQGGIRGLAALESAAVAAGHTHNPPDCIDVQSPESGRVYRIVKTMHDAHAPHEAGVIVYTLAEIVNILESSQLVNVVAKREAADVKKEAPQPFDFSRGDDVP